MMNHKRTPEEVILYRLLALLNASYWRLSTVSGDTLFINVNLGFADDRILCDRLSESLGVPAIPSNYFRQIPTQMEVHDFGPKNRSANLKLTIRQFAEKIAHWLSKKHPNIQLGAPQTA